MEEKKQGLKLTSFQEDALREVGNVGAGKASGALAKMINSTVLIEMTKVKMMKLTDVSEIVGGPTIPAVGILFDVTGTLPGYLLMLSPKKTSLSMLNLINPKRDKNSDIIDKFDKDTLKEIGNILAGSYLAAMSDLSGLNLIESLPKLILNNTPSIINEIIATYDPQVYFVLVLETKLKIQKEHFTQQLIFVLKAESFNKLFDALIEKLKIGEKK